MGMTNRQIMLLLRFLVLATETLGVILSGLHSPHEILRADLRMLNDDILKEYKRVKEELR